MRQNLTIPLQYKDFKELQQQNPGFNASQTSLRTNIGTWSSNLTYFFIIWRVKVYAKLKHHLCTEKILEYKALIKNTK